MKLGFIFKYLLTGTWIWFLFFFNIQAQEDRIDSADSVVHIQEEMQKGTLSEVSDKELKHAQSMNVMELFSKADNLKQLNKMLEPIRKMSESELTNIILSNQKAHPLFELMANNPKLLTFIIRLLKDEKAIQGLVEVTSHKAKIYIYLVFLVITILLNHWFKIKIIKNIESMMKRFFVHVGRIIFFVVLRLTVFLILFYAFLKPSILIIYSLG
ncbi:MAG: hypothetical protein A2381_05840 [Bdellovibrionales bacterium RIFOXYB1_FULL_37_110]|nr:MAG: hypothetical protein A2417_04725 [Bdellovibrionales bacterium RIFOXYC1_FULL_37_79]OFZ59343.1 MAG: hypothetical protein A2381_05840 [Bdellovibrionales bacterium RIFOXYB1_FULL_37_110]OFZ61903.1 MAG: hypothetical protein A2577_17725 [Bdellovibrionales bacterium RIFOXYD1_FULL_36_51]